MPHLTLLEKGLSRTHHIKGTEALVGRDPACGVFLEGDEAKTVSGRHARLFLDGATWFIEDAGSRNGTYIGTRKLEPGTRHALAVGEVIGLGLTGTQLSVIEVVGRAFAATLLEPAPAVPPPVHAGGTVPIRRSEAVRAGIIDVGAGDSIRLELRNMLSGARLAGHGEKISIGRSLECIIRIEGDGATSVSRVHAEVSVANGKAMLRDGGSRHGTFVNGRKIDGATTIKVGDVIMLGQGGPSFSVQDVGLDNGPAPAISTPPDSAALRDPEGAVFQSELPTPALARPAAKASAQPAPEARPRSTARKAADASPRTAMPLKTIGVGGSLVAAGIVVGVIFGTQRPPRPALDTANQVTQQSAGLESLRATARRDVAIARASLDSATLAAAPPEVLDSLRQLLTAAEQRSAALADSSRRTP